MRDIRITTGKALVFVVLYANLVKQILSYSGVKYSILKGSAHAYTQLPITDMKMFVFTAIVLVCLLFLFGIQLYKGRLNIGKVYAVVSLALIVSTVSWTLITLVDIGFVKTMYSSTSPFVYLTALAFCIGLDEELFDFFLTHAKILGLISLGISICSYLVFLDDHKGAILGNSSVLVYFIQGFWLLCIYSFCSKKQTNSFVYFIIILCGVMAILFNSRSWIIQSAIWLIAYVYCSSKKKLIEKVFKLVVVLLVCVVVVYYIADNFFPETLQSLVDKTSPTDSREGQYIDLFAQTNFWDYIFGKGYGFRYYSSIQGGMYSYIDNAYLFMLIRYGLGIGLAYTLMFLIPLFKAKFSRVSVPIFMWLLALGGLSVYCVTTVDLKSIALAVVAGRCIWSYNQRRENLIKT